MPKYNFYYVDFYVKDRLGKESLISGHTVASSISDAKRRIRTEYKVTRFGKITKAKGEFNKPDTEGIA